MWPLIPPGARGEPEDDEGQLVEPGPSLDDVDAIPVEASEGIYYGYDGPLYSRLQWDTGLTVLTRTVGHPPWVSSWAAGLLVRNDTLQTVGAITVTATLRDSKGVALGEVSGTSEVLDVRPGEPVPVMLVSQVPKERVASVDYRAVSREPAGTERRIDTMDDVDYAAGNRDPITAWPESNPLNKIEAGESPPYPHRVVIVTNNDSQRTLTSYTMVVALHRHGRVLATYAVPRLQIGQTQEQLSFGAQFVVSVDATSAAAATPGSSPGDFDFANEVDPRLWDWVFGESK